METFDLRAFQLKLLDILIQVDEVCKNHHIRYYLVAGTLLGAIRHKGFIPWDDDIDIAMPRPDYEKFMAHANEWLPEPLELASPETMDDYPFTFAKVQDTSTTLLERRKLQYVGGICIDVFPLDGISASKWDQCWMSLRNHIYDKLLYFICRDPYKHGHGLRAIPSLFCRKFFKKKFLQNNIKQIHCQYYYDSMDYVIDHDFPRKRGIAPKAAYGEPVPVEFEGKMFNGVQQPDTLLRITYGDYMVIPPHPKQKQHCYRVVDFNKPYREYNETL